MFDAEKKMELLKKMDEADVILRELIGYSGIYVSEREHFSDARDKLQAAITETLKAK